MRARSCSAASGSTGWGNAGLARWRSHHVGFIFQFYNLMPTLNAERNVECPLLLTALGRAERRRHVATPRWAHRRAAGPRAAQAERAVGRAAAARRDRPARWSPTRRSWCCDEPTGDLDRQTADEILDLLRTLNREQGKTIIMVTHDQKAADYASRQLHVDKGQADRRPDQECRIEIPAAGLGRVVAQAHPDGVHAAVDPGRLPAVRAAPRGSMPRSANRSRAPT